MCNDYFLLGRCGLVWVDVGFLDQNPSCEKLRKIRGWTDVGLWVFFFFFFSMSWFFFFHIKFVMLE